MSLRIEGSKAYSLAGDSSLPVSSPPSPQRPLRPTALALLVFALGCDRGCGRAHPVDAGGAPPTVDAETGPAPTSPPRVRLPHGHLKGQLHAHSSGSADSATPAPEVRRFYEAHGYDFVVLTDHNVVSVLPNDGQRPLVLAGVELTMNPRVCNPPAVASACALHLNALFVDAKHEGWVDIAPPPASAKPIRRREAYAAEVDRALALGGTPMLCHPNFVYSGPTVDDLVLLAQRGLRLIEIRNEAWDSQNEGDAAHPSTEALWDGALARGAHLYGTATDDAHHYEDAAELRERGERPFDGDHGFVVVLADKDEASIRHAIEAGDFYASTGLVFTSIERAAHALTVATDEPADFEVITKAGVVRRERGTKLEARLEASDGPYVRVRAARDGASAWTQPVFR